MEGAHLQTPGAGCLQEASLLAGDCRADTQREALRDQTQTRALDA